MLISKYRASLNANVIEGLYRPFSNEPMVCRDTSSAAIHPSRLPPITKRTGLSEVKPQFHGAPPFYGKPAFHISIIAEGAQMSSTLSIQR